MSYGRSGEPMMLQDLCPGRDLGAPPKQPKIAGLRSGAVHRSTARVVRFRGRVACATRGKDSGLAAAAAPPADRSSAAAYAIGSLLMKGRLSHFLPAATMQLIPFGVVLTTVQVSFCVEA
jgi:hypothetical protein